MLPRLIFLACRFAAVSKKCAPICIKPLIDGRPIINAMRRIYSRVRIALTTFTLGLAGVWMANIFAITDQEVFVDVPTAASDYILFVFPVETKNILQWPNGQYDTGLGYFCVNHLPPDERRQWIAEYEAQERLRKAKRI